MAEGIKISEMEQITTLEDGCCFPVVSNGENKKITQKNLYKTMETYMDEYKYKSWGAKATSIANGTDLNNVKTEGLYYSIWEHNCKNIPKDFNSDYEFILEVFTFGSTVFQRITERNSGRVCVRTYDNGSNGYEWRKWNNLAGNIEVASLQQSDKEIIERINVYVASLQQSDEEINADISNLQNQINSIKKPDGIEVFRIGINESTSSWELITEANPDRTTSSYFRKKTFNVSGQVINTCVNNGNCEFSQKIASSNENYYKTNGNTVTITIYLGSGIAQPSDVICKGYIEYVYL